jgi:hypothetical protein
MGLLDEAIREHLELKRRHGGDEDEIARQEAEAFGPAPVEELDEEEPFAGFEAADEPEELEEGAALDADADGGPYDRAAEAGLTGERDLPDFEWHGSMSADIDMPSFVVEEEEEGEPDPAVLDAPTEAFTPVDLDSDAELDDLEPPEDEEPPSPYEPRDETLDETVAEPPVAEVEGSQTYDEPLVSAADEGSAPPLGDLSFPPPPGEDELSAEPGEGEPAFAGESGIAPEAVAGDAEEGAVEYGLEEEVEFAEDELTQVESSGGGYVLEEPAAEGGYADEPYATDEREEGLEPSDAGSVRTEGLEQQPLDARDEAGPDDSQAHEQAPLEHGPPGSDEASIVDQPTAFMPIPHHLSDEPAGDAEMRAEPLEASGGELEDEALPTDAQAPPTEFEEEALPTDEPLPTEFGHESLPTELEHEPPPTEISSEPFAYEPPSVTDLPEAEDEAGLLAEDLPEAAQTPFEEPLEAGEGSLPFPEEPLAEDEPLAAADEPPPLAEEPTELADAAPLEEDVTDDELAGEADPEEEHPPPTDPRSARGFFEDTQQHEGIRREQHQGRDPDFEG